MNGGDWGLGNDDRLGYSSCFEGFLEHVVVSDDQTGIPNVSAQRCGLGSLLAYLCFIDKVTQGQQKGYNILQDPMHAVIESRIPGWIANYHQGCDKIIHAIDSQVRNGIDPIQGNKAVMYAALAANFNKVVTYNPNSGEAFIFRVSSIIDDFNVRDPRDNLPNMPDFAEHYGVFWYFCKEISEE